MPPQPKGNPRFQTDASWLLTIDFASILRAISASASTAHPGTPMDAGQSKTELLSSFLKLVRQLCQNLFMICWFLFLGHVRISKHSAKAAINLLRDLYTRVNYRALLFGNTNSRYIAALTVLYLEFVFLQHIAVHISLLLSLYGLTAASLSPTNPNKNNNGRYPNPLMESMERTSKIERYEFYPIVSQIQQDSINTTPTTTTGIIHSNISKTARSHPGPLNSHPINMYSGIPSSHSYANLNASPPKKGGLKSSHTFSNLPMPISGHKPSKKRLSSQASIATTYANAIAQPTTTEQKTENVPPRKYKPSFGLKSNASRATSPSPQKPLRETMPNKAKPKPSGGIPRSRTFSVLSNLTASLSRTSLGQLANSDSRRTSTSSKGMMSRKSSAPYNADAETAASSSSQALLDNQQPQPTNIRQIYTAQPSAYWSGRFMALQDRFQSEMLLPENLKMLVAAHCETSLVPNADPQPSALKASATTGNIMTVAGSSGTATTTAATPAATTRTKTQQKTPAHLSTKSASPRKPRRPAKSPFRPTNGASTLPKPKSKPKPTAQAIRPTTKATGALHLTRGPSSDTPRDGGKEPSSSTAAAQMLANEDNRSRRIFLHLDAMCATPEARASLRQWQQSYARRVGKENLLPEGGSMYDRHRELTWVGRLLSGAGSGGMSASGSDSRDTIPRHFLKRGSLGL
ncbi:hypothetical protein F5Y16DRAFT_424552 [Xylariaceae sp. FL0255]|nr:hypothetical protein F5Y16DRAFT_424552 [Xylariaceae sp. FL0255]